MGIIKDFLEKLKSIGLENLCTDYYASKVIKCLIQNLPTENN